MVCLPCLRQQQHPLHQDRLNNNIPPHQALKPNSLSAWAPCLGPCQRFFDAPPQTLKRGSCRGWSELACAERRLVGGGVQGIRPGGTGNRDQDEMSSCKRCAGLSTTGASTPQTHLPLHVCCCAGTAVAELFVQLCGRAGPSCQ